MIIESGSPTRVQTETDLPRIVIVDEDSPTRRSLETLLRASGWMPVLVSDAQQACDILVSNEGPRLALVDGGTSARPGTDLVRHVRAVSTVGRPYLILLTGQQEAKEILSGLEAGVDDCLDKPIVLSELQMRVRNGLRTLALQEELAVCLCALDAAAAQVRQLQSLLPICSYCRRIRDDEHRWQHLDEYLSDHTPVRFTHGFCPQCYEQHVQPTLAAS